MIEIRGLSLLQPWASFMALGEKRIETRSWPTKYRGWIALPSSKSWRREDRAWAEADPSCRAVWAKHGVTSLDQIPLGQVLSIARLVDVVRTETVLDVARALPLLPYELDFGNYGPDRWAWIFEEALALPEPVPVRGSLGLYTLPEDVVAAIAAQMEIA
jgi:hypothetical protein